MPQTSGKALSDFQALSFDCYGTLVDWESGLWEGLQSLIARLPEDHDLKFKQKDTLRLFQGVKASIQHANPTMLYSMVLEQAYTDFSKLLGISQTSDDKAKAFAESLQAWKAFPDTLEALHRLKTRFRLIILSNVDNASFGRTLLGPLEQFPFDLILTAEDIGSYKPSHRNFEFMFESVESKFSISRRNILHVAQSLIHDHVPAKELGLDSAWIARGSYGGDSGMGGNPEQFTGKVSFKWQFASLGELADAVEREHCAHKAETRPASLAKDTEDEEID